MAKAAKKVSINKIETLLNENNEVAVRLSDDVEILVKKYLTLDESLMLIKSVFSACVSEDTGVFTPEAYEFALRISVIENYTNIRVPSDMDLRYRFAFETDIFDRVVEIADANQYTSNLSAINRKIGHALEKINSAAEYTASVILERFDEISKKVGETFEVFNSDDVKGLFTNVLADEGVQKSLIDVVRQLNIEEADEG